MVICFSLAAGTRMSHSASKRFSSVIYKKTKIRYSVYAAKRQTAKWNA